MLKCELKKIFSKKINRIILSAAFLLAIIFSLFAIKSMRYCDKDGVLYTGTIASRNLAVDKNRWKGELTADKIAEVMKSRKELIQKYPEGIPDSEYGKIMQSYDDIIGFVIGVMTPDIPYDDSVLSQLTDEQIDNVYAEYKKNMQIVIADYGKTSEQNEFLAKQYNKLEIPLIYEAKDSWDTMALYAETYGIILAVIIGFLSAGIFAEEFQTRAEAVFFSSKYGRSRATRNKITAGILITTIVYWIGIGMLSLISFGIMGVSGFHTPYQIGHPYSIYAMTYGQYYLLILLCGYIACLFAAMVTMLITAKMHTASVAICIPFFMYCMMPFIGRVFSSFTNFFNLMPNVLINIIESVKVPIIFQIGNIVFRQVPFVMFIYILISVILLPFVYRGYSRYGLVKR